jgi:hypothetical protein
MLVLFYITWICSTEIIPGRVSNCINLSTIYTWTCEFRMYRQIYQHSQMWRLAAMLENHFLFLVLYILASGEKYETSAFRQLCGGLPRYKQWWYILRQTMSNVACIPITEPFCQFTDTSEFMSQTHVQFMWALGKGQTEGKFNILSTH